MATDEAISALRLLIAEPTEDNYAQETLSARIDAAEGDLNLVAYQVWTEKAARFAGLGDISEGGSSRRNSSLQSQAMTLVKHFAGLLPAESTSGTAGLRIKKLTR
jgi:hypothetical protein